MQSMGTTFQFLTSVLCFRWRRGRRWRSGFGVEGLGFCSSHTFASRAKWESRRRCSSSTLQGMRLNLRRLLTLTSFLRSDCRGHRIEKCKQRDWLRPRLKILKTPYLYRFSSYRLPVTRKQTIPVYKQVEASLKEHGCHFRSR